MKITIQRGVFTKAVVPDNDGVRIPCTNDEDVLREVKIFLNKCITLQCTSTHMHSVDNPYTRLNIYPVGIYIQNIFPTPDQYDGRRTSRR